MVHGEAIFRNNDAVSNNGLVSLGKPTLSAQPSMVVIPHQLTSDSRKVLVGCKVNYMRGIPIMHESLLKCREWRFHLPKSNFGNPHAVTDLWVNSEVDGNIEITGFYFGTRPYGSPQSRFEPLIMFRMTSKTDGRSKISGWFLVFFGIFTKSLIMIFGLLWALFAKSERWLWGQIWQLGSW